MKLGPEVRLFRGPVPKVGFCNPAREARVIALDAHSNTRFRAKVVEGIVAEQQNSDRRSV